VNHTIKREHNAAARNRQVKSASATHHHAPLGLRTVAIFELAKGWIVLVAGLGLLSLIHHDAQAVAEEIVRRLHLNPAYQYPRIFIDFAGHLTDARLWFMSIAALVYAAVRFVEAYGLWHELAWAEWFAVLTSGMFLPVELSHLFMHWSLVALCVPLVNIGIVIYLAMLLAANARRKANRESDK
jgi:uncharacterized membrane protein (DUF2068 family)